MSNRSSVSGMEVPIIGTDALKWLDLSVSAHDDYSLPVTITPSHPDYASSSVLRNPPHYFIWRIDGNRPRSLELLELSSSPDFGLRITFPNVLFHFAYICRNETSSSPSRPYLLYALTISGSAYLIKLRNLASYSASSSFTLDEIVQFNLRSYFNNTIITAVVATAGSLLVGKNDGSVSCFRLGLLDHTAPGFEIELRDNVGIGRLWGFVSRNRIVGGVQDLVIQEVHGLKLLFVLHSDGMLRVWDLMSCTRVLSHNISVPNPEGATLIKLWVGEASDALSTIPLAIRCRYSMETRMERICIYRLRYNFGEKIILFVESRMLNIHMEEGELVDVKIFSEKIWILKDNGLISHNLLLDNDMEDAHCYAMQEDLVAEQLFQNSEVFSVDLLQETLSQFSLLMKDYSLPFVSSIFLRRLLQPGIYQGVVLRLTLLDYDRCWTENEFQLLTLDGMIKEIRSLLEHESGGDSATTLLTNWINFGARYLDYWCKLNSPCGLLFDSDGGAIGLIRKNSISLFRDMESIELLSDGHSEEIARVIGSGLDLADKGSGNEVLSEVLGCIVNMSQRLGKAAGTIFYESLVNAPVISFEEIVSLLLKMIETGFISSMSSLHVLDFGGDLALEKEVADHKNLRKFSVGMLVSLHSLSRKAGSWDTVLNAVESYVQFLVPRKTMQNFEADRLFNVNTSILVQATSQIAKVMLESAFDVLLFVNYLLHVSGQIHMHHGDTSRIQLELIPMIQEIVFEWLIIYFLCTTPSQSPAIDDFSSQLSSLHIDGNSSKRSWKEKLGKCDFPLAFILSLTNQFSSQDGNDQCLPDSQGIICSVWQFTSWIIWGKTGEECTSFLRQSIEIASILLKHAQYEAVEFLLTVVESNSQRERISKSIQDCDGHWCVLQHLLGCCFLAQAQSGFYPTLREKKVCEAIRRFFRASCGGAFQALLDSLHYTGLPHLDVDGSVSPAVWKFHYYQWAMQLFEQYNVSEGAYQFALAALEQVDETVIQKDNFYGTEIQNESATAVKGRLWANVFKFTLDLNLLHDSYCSILSNPDDESKYICLRRFIIVLYEQGKLQVLCDGQLPFIGLAEKIEQELAWKADRSDIFMKPSPYKLLYTFEMRHHNWRKAASYMYQYSVRLRSEGILKDQQHMSLVLQERLNALSAAINALHLVNPAYAWIDLQSGANSQQNDHYPSKKAKKTVNDRFTRRDFQADSERPWFYIDAGTLEKEFVLTSAEYLLSLVNIKWKFTGTDNEPADLVDLLVETNLYDMAFTVLLNFWKGSILKRELEKVFCAISLKCCPNNLGSSFGANGLLLTSSMEETGVHGSPDIGCESHQLNGNAQWETLELYLEKYKAFHAGLPVVVAETLLRSDPQIELPLWLVHMFKYNRRDRIWGMTGEESNPSSLFRLYVDYGRYTEATNLLLEYIESFALVRPSDLINRKKPSSVWFPYTTIERLWLHLEESIKSGYMVDQCDKLKKLLHGALVNHLKLVKIDSDDALSSAGV